MMVNPTSLTVGDRALIKESFISKNSDNHAYLEYIVLPNHRAPTFMIDKWDMHTKEKRHTKKYVVWGFYISKNINIIIII